MEYFECSLDNDTNTILKIFLVKDVKNTAEIRNNILKGTWNCAVIKPSLIIDPFQIAVAANRAVISEKSNTLVTKTVYTEILYNLSISKNITQSLSKFGIEKDSEIIVCFLIKENDSSEDILNQIDGKSCQISDLYKFTNLKDIKAAYKLNNLKCDIDLLDIVVSRMVTKNFVSF